MTTQPALGLLRSIGNVFRRPDAIDGGESTLKHTLDGTILANMLGPRRMDGGMDAESPDLYYEDRPLGASIHALEQIRLSLRHLTQCSNNHSQMLLMSANSQTQLGEALIDAVTPHTSSTGHRQSSDDRAADLTDLAVTSVRSNDGENLSAPHHATFLSPQAIDAQATHGRALSVLAEVSTKLSAAISTPINDLTKSFEDRYTRKIVPLRRRYMDQKGQYLKYKRCADMAETDEKRSYFEALAEAAKPVWLRTSTELRTEADVMTEITAKNMAQWSRTVALQHERALAISAANMAEAFTLAKELPPFKPRSDGGK